MQKYLNHVYAGEVILFFLIIFGAVPRSFAFVLAGILIIYTLFASLENATVLFVRSIPLFIALPLTTSFDNFNTWRILALIIFLKWLWQRPRISFSIPLVSLLVISILSIFVAQDQTAAILRVIYFVNLSMVAIVMYYLPNKRRIILNFIPPLAIVLAVGFFQLISTYFGDIYDFVNLWGWGVQCRQFGMEWCRIAVEQGNTWFAYNSFGQINLRMFSLFTDSHTFPMYILMAIPAVFAYAAERLDFSSLKTASHIRTSMWIVLVPLGFLAAILSNTRGIWLAGWVMTIVAIISALVWKKTILRYLAIWMAIFVLLFALVYPISATPQFGLSWRSTFGNRILSILNFGETSNALRIAIWKASLNSIVRHPLLGVGIGNFPVVLEQNISLAKAGSSAHNVYLHIGAELGIPALIIALLFFWLMLKKIFDGFRSAINNFDALYFGALLIMIPWLYGYLMTDAALFDERAFLMFSTVVATILAYGKAARIN